MIYHRRSAVQPRSFVRQPDAARGRGAPLGFTLVEMLTVIAILVILASLAGPSYVSLIRSQRVKTASNDLVATLVFARSEAVKRNADVSVAHAGSSWADGWSVTFSGASGTETLRRIPALNSMTVSGGPASITFYGTGRADSSTTFTIDSSPQTAGVDARCVEVRTDGMPRSWIERGGNHDCSND